MRYRMSKEHLLEVMVPTAEGKDKWWPMCCPFQRFDEDGGEGYCGVWCPLFGMVGTDMVRLFCGRGRDIIIEEASDAE